MERQVCSEDIVFRASVVARGAECFAARENSWIACYGGFLGVVCSVCRRGRGRCWFQVTL